MFEGKRRWVSQLRQSEFTLHLLFCSMQPLNGLDDAHSHWWGWSIPCNNSNAKLLHKPSETHPEMTLYRFSGHPMARSSWHTKWSVTGMMTESPQDGWKRSWAVLPHRKGHRAIQETGSVQAGGTFASEAGSLWGSLGKIFLYLTATNGDGAKERCAHFSGPHAPHLAVVQPLGPGQLFCDPMDCSPPGSMGFSKQEYWSWLPFPSPGNLPRRGIEPMSPCRRVLYRWARREAHTRYITGNFSSQLTLVTVCSLTVYRPGV